MKQEMRNVAQEIRHTFVPLYRDYLRITPSYRTALVSVFAAGYRYRERDALVSRRRLTFWTTAGGVEKLSKRFWYYDVTHLDEKHNMYHARMKPAAIMDERLPELEVYEAKKIPLDLYVNGRNGTVSHAAVLEWFDDGRLSASVAWPLLHRSGLENDQGDTHFALAGVTLFTDNFLDPVTGQVPHDLQHFLAKTLYKTSVCGQLFIAPHASVYISRRDHVQVDGLLIPGGCFRLS